MIFLITRLLNVLMCNCYEKFPQGQGWLVNLKGYCLKLCEIDDAKLWMKEMKQMKQMSISNLGLVKASSTGGKRRPPKR